jgi:High potential iron-sulfur protein
MSDILTRRALVKKIGVVAGALAVAKFAAADAAVSPPHVADKDPMAVALGYIADVAKIDPKKTPTWKTGQKCSNCLQLQGKAGDAFRPCNLFPGKLVSANGWCKAYVKKP